MTAMTAKERANAVFERLAEREDVWKTHGLPGTLKQLAICEEITVALRAHANAALEDAEKRWEAQHGFDKHGVGDFLRALREREE